MTALKPCPFCGGEAKYYHLRLSYAPTSFATINVECSKCHSTSDTVIDEVESKAIERVTDAWNTRAENTCRVRPTTKDDDPYADGSTFTCLECGFPWLDEFSAYCSSCGRKVVQDDN